MVIGDKFIGKVEHLGIIVPDIKEIEKNAPKLGISKMASEPGVGGMASYRGGEMQEFTQDNIFAQMGEIYVEFITPTSGQTVNSEFLKENPLGGINHIGLMCDSVEHKEEVAEYLRSLGCEEVHRTPGPGEPPTNNLFFFDTRKYIGTMVELMIPVPYDMLPPARKMVQEKY